MNDVRRRTVVYGDTSGFHLGSRLNYAELRKLLSLRCEILSEIPYDFFIPPPIPPRPFVSYRAFAWRLRNSRYWSDLRNCERIVVHGEGLTAKGVGPAYLCLNFGLLARELGVEAWLVDFAAHEARELVEHYRSFDYLAARDPISVAHLAELGIAAELSFDCCVLAAEGIPPLDPEPTGIVAIRGKKQTALLQALGGIEHARLDAAWRWTKLGPFRGRFADLLGLPDPESVSRETVEEYVEYLSHARFSVTTSFHANIFSFMAGIPFIALLAHGRGDRGTRKYEGNVVDLLPEEHRGVKLSDVQRPGFDERRWRADVHEHCRRTLPQLQARARRNIPSLA